MAVPRRFSASFRKLPTIFGVFSDLCGFGFTLMAGSFIFLSTTACIETDAEEIKQKKGSKRVRKGVSRMITVLQMDFQGRRELEVAKTGLSRYRKKNVIAFAKWAS